jgi:acyl-CoA synthetase (AMP-forming)/AMP-acid ligase II
MYSDYGATEALPVAEIAGAEVLGDTWAATERGAGLCVGRPFPGVEVRIVAVDDGAIRAWSDATELGAGEIGEVVVRSPHVSEDYHRQPRADEKNKIPSPDGAWHRVGDTGYLDAAGRLWVCGRRSHRVVTGRGTAYPLCIEPVYNAHPAVRRSALVGLDDATGRREAVVCVELAPGADAPSALADLERLGPTTAATRLVDRIVLVDHLPVDRRHNAKIDRPHLADLIERRQPGP